ncbi:MAG: hypothetical protein ABJN22_11125 [Litorimonas sp.]
MRPFLTFFLGLLVLVIVALALRTDETYSPSIATLRPNETLVMKYSACHNGCDKANIKFKNSTAKLRGHSLELTPDEIGLLDHQFLLANNLSDEYFCSLKIMIGFKKTSAFKFPVKKNAKQYPCAFADLRDSITPEGLFYHLDETPEEIPFWRRSDETAL